MIKAVHTHTATCTQIHTFIQVTINRIMSQLLVEQRHFLMMMASTSVSREQKQVILDTISKPQLRAVTEISHNLLIGHITMTSGEKAVLKRYATKLREVADSRNSAAKRRSALTVTLIEHLMRLVLDIIKNL